MLKNTISHPYLGLPLRRKTFVKPQFYLFYLLYQFFSMRIESLKKIEIDVVEIVSVAFLLSIANFFLSSAAHVTVSPESFI